MPQRKYEEGWENRKVRKKTPLNAKRLLLELGISQVALSQDMNLWDGRQPHESTVAQILNRNIWPSRTSKAALKEQIARVLQANGATEEEVATAFQLDDTPDQPMRMTRQDHRASTGRGVPTAYENQLPETEMLSQAARKHFQLFRDPFADDVQSADDVYLSSEQRYIREAMYQTAKHGGFIAVVGESGAGKTTLRRDLLERIAREKAQISVVQPQIIDKGRLSAGAICDAIINDVSHERPVKTLEAKARQIQRLLTGSSRAGNVHVLIIEEAHDLSLQTLKYLKRFWELEDGFRKLLSIILVGQPELKNKLDERQNWEAREVIRRCEIAELRPLNGNLEEYLALKFERAGKGLDELFDPDTFDAVRERLLIRRRGATQGGESMMYPLVVNNTITKAMNLAAEIGAELVSAEIIKEV